MAVEHMLSLLDRKANPRNRPSFPCERLLAVLTFVQRNDEAKCAMVIRKRYVMPEIDREEAGLGAAELIGFVEELTCEANTAYETRLALKAEVARLRKAKRRGSGTLK
jgi:hypothetical protein